MSQTSYAILASRRDMGYAFMMDLILQSLPLFVCALYIIEIDNPKIVIQVFVFAAKLLCFIKFIFKDFRNVKPKKPD